MKPLLFILAVMLFSIDAPLRAQQLNGGNYLIGIWETQNGKAQVKITKSSNYFYGRIIQLKEPLNEQKKPKLDENNPDPEKRNLTLIETQILWGIEYNIDKDVWYDGTIYDPENGKTYKCKITKNGDTQLHIREYTGVSMIGRTAIWKRVE